VGVGLGAAGAATASFVMASELSSQNSRHITTMYQSLFFI